MAPLMLTFNHSGIIQYPSGGLAFVALLASTEGVEVFKALSEKESEGDGQTVTLPSGLAYRDIKVSAMSYGPGSGNCPHDPDFHSPQLTAFNKSYVPLSP